MDSEVVSPVKRTIPDGSGFKAIAKIFVCWLITNFPN